MIRNLNKNKLVLLHFKFNYSTARQRPTSSGEPKNGVKKAKKTFLFELRRIPSE